MNNTNSINNMNNLMNMNNIKTITSMNTNLIYSNPLTIPHIYPTSLLPFLPNINTKDPS